MKTELIESLDFTEEDYNEKIAAATNKDIAATTSKTLFFIFI